MTKLEYFKTSLKFEYLTEYDWYVACFTELNSSNTFYNAETQQFKAGEEWVTIDGFKEVLFKRDDLVTLDNSDLVNLKGKTELTIGKVLLIFFYYTFPFGDKIMYDGEEVNLKSVDNKFIQPNIIKNRDLIKPRELEKLSSACTFSATLSHIFVLGVTRKLNTPPKGLETFKKNLKKEMNDTYGEEWTKDLTIVAKYKDKLKAFDKEYLKEDIERGSVLLRGKIVNVARPKLYLTIGSETNFDEAEDPVFIDDPLSYGLVMKEEAIVQYFNSIRSGSFFKGSETQIAGVIAAILIRAMHQYVIDVEDCKTKEGIEKTITKDNVKYYKGSYSITGEVIDESMIGKKIIMRSPRRCKAKGFSYCKKCMGDLSSMLEDNPMILASTMGGIYLNILMKQMHDSNVYTVPYRKTDMFG